MNTIILTLSFVLVVTVYLTSASPIPKEQSPVFYNPYRFKRFGQDKNLKANNEADSQSIVYVPNGAVNNVNSNSLQPDDSNQKDRQLRQIPAEVPERVARQIYPAEEDEFHTRSLLPIALPKGHKHGDVDDTDIDVEINPYGKTKTASVPIITTTPTPPGGFWDEFCRKCVAACIACIKACLPCINVEGLKIPIIGKAA